MTLEHGPRAPLVDEIEPIEACGTLEPIRDTEETAAALRFTWRHSWIFTWMLAALALAWAISWLLAPF